MPIRTGQAAAAGEPELVVHQALQTQDLVIEVRDYCWPEPRHEAALVSESWFLDLSLTARPGAPHGRYMERWSRRRSEPIGDVLLMAPALEFRGSHGSGRQTSLSLRLAPRLFGLGLEDLDEAKLAAGLHVQDTQVRRGLWGIAVEVRRRRLESPALIEAAAISIAARLEQQLRRTALTKSVKTGGLAPARLKRIEERLRADLPPPKLGELARLCGLSERQLARAFRQEAGESIGQRVATVTLQRAWMLLTRSTLPVSAIAGALGYSSSASFATAFRNSTGCAPSAVRARGAADDPPAPTRSPQLRGTVSNQASPSGLAQTISR